MEKGATNSLAHELEAMAVIGEALGELTDLSARQRVLKWAAERFDVDIAFAVERLPEPVASASPAAADLALDSLDDIFPLEPELMDSDFAVSDNVVESAIFETCDADTAKLPIPDTAALPIEVVLRSFAEDFQRFAKEWNGAAA